MEPMLSLAFSRVHHLLRKCLRPPTRKTHPNTWSVSPPQRNQEMIKMCLDDLSCENSHWRKLSFRNIFPLPRHNILGQMNFSTPKKGVDAFLKPRSLKPESTPSLGGKKKPESKGDRFHQMFLPEQQGPVGLPSCDDRWKKRHKDGTRGKQKRGVSVEECSIPAVLQTP